MSASGALVGLLGGTGIVALIAWLRARRPLPLLLRIGPFVGVPGTAEASLRRVRRPRVRTPRSRSTGALRPETVLLGAAVGLLAGSLLAVGGASPMAVLLLGALGALAAGQLGRALARSRENRRRRAIQRQLPMLADLLSLAVTAGMTPVAGLEAAAASLHGPIADEVHAAVADAHSGASAETALRRLGERVRLPELDRLMDAILLAVAMGTPLAEVVRGQASDLRVEERRVLMEVAGRKDAVMLVPIVFLVLPSVLAIALYPGLQSLRVVLP